MEPESKISTPPERLEAAAAPPQEGQSEWEAFIAGKETAARFLKKVSTGPVTLPDPEIRKRFVNALLTAPERAARLLLLLQNSSKYGETVTRIVLELTELFIQRLQIVSAADQLDAETFRDRIAGWLSPSTIVPSNRST